MPPRLDLYRYCFPRDAASSPWGGHHAAPLARAALWRAPSPPGGGLREILVHPPVVLVALQKLTLDERLDPLLDHVRVGHEAGGQLRSHVGDESVVLHLLARLHDADDRSLDLRLSVLVHLLARLVLLRLRLALRRDRADLEAQLLGGEGGVEGEGVRLVNLAPLRLLEQELELAAREGLQRPLQLGRGDGRVARDVGVAQPVVVVEEQQHAHHVRRHVDLVPRGAELRLEVRVAHRGLPLQSPAGVLLQVVLAEHLAAARHRRGQVAAAGDLGRPEARREHLHRQVDRLDLARAVGGAELVLRVGRHLHVHEHALELGGELVAALLLELLDHRALDVVRDGAAAEQPLGEVLLVVLFEDVLLLQVAEEHHHLVEHCLDLVLRRAAHALAHLLVDKEGDVLGRALVEVDEVLEGRVQRVEEGLVSTEGALDDALVLVSQREQSLDKLDRVARGARLLRHQLLPPSLDVPRHELADHAQPVGRRHSAEELVRPLEVWYAVVLEHGHDARVLHLCEGAHVLGDELPLDHLVEPPLGRLVEVVCDPLVLLAQPRLRLAHVLGGRVLGEALVRLLAVKVRRRLEEGYLKVALVDVLAELDEHGSDCLDDASLDRLGAPLPVDQVEHRREQPALDAIVAADFVAEDLQPALEHGHLLLGDDVGAIHVHEDVTDHDGRQPVLFPLLLELRQKVAVGRNRNLLRNAAQVEGDGLDEPVVQLVAKLVQHHVVRIAVQLLEREPRRVLPVDLVDG
mmetsp:Transcript_23744/g.77363  ORF Transcript_23744/g.77363 Transcript_23744/m.77363 type:complete len:746 (+) Transcript_23744:257-2494(+)